MALRMMRSQGITRKGFGKIHWSAQWSVYIWLMQVLLSVAFTLS